METTPSAAETPVAVQPQPVNPTGQAQMYTPSVSLGPTPFAKSLGGGITTIVFASLAVISPWMPYLSSDGTSVSGWTTASEILDYEERFSAGPALVLITGIIALASGITIVTKQNRGQAANRQGLGLAILISGIVMMVSAAVTYNILDELARNEGIFVETGLGLSLGVITGIAILVMGIIVLAKPSVTQGRKA
jgi:hypothetical protein